MDAMAELDCDLEKQLGALLDAWPRTRAIRKQIVTAKPLSEHFRPISPDLTCDETLSPDLTCDEDPAVAVGDESEGSVANE
jgi:hypothetical protein